MREYYSGATGGRSHTDGVMHVAEEEAERRIGCYDYTMHDEGVPEI